MASHMQPHDAKLYQRIEEVVHYIWDPIGISQLPSARDEYSGYMTAIYGNVKAGELGTLIEYMKCVVEHMGLQYDHESVKEAAQVMLAWKDFIADAEAERL